MTVGSSLAPLLEQVGEAMGHRSIAAAESCTAGLPDVGLAVTGVSGPSAQEGKPVGLTYVAVASDTQTAVREHRFTAGRAANRVAAVEAVLELAAESIGSR